jgi:hypothetical protein
MRSVGIPNLVTSISAPSLWLFVDRRRIYDDIKNVLRFEPIVERTRALWRSTRRASVLSVPDCLGQRQRGSICLRAAPVSGLIGLGLRAPSQSATDFHRGRILVEVVGCVRSSRT